MIVTIKAVMTEKLIPSDYSSVFVSLIKKCLSESCVELFEEFYVKKNNEQKDFSFAVKFKEPVFKSDVIEVDGKELEMQLHILDPKNAIDFYNAFMKQKGKIFPMPLGNQLTIIDVNIRNHRLVKSRKILIKMNSPLLVRIHENGKDYYLAYNDDCFNKYLNMSVNLSTHNQDSTEKITIKPLNAKKTVVRTFGSKITGNIGVYELEADIELLNKLVQTGIGSRKSQGFGCFDVIREVI